MLCKEGREIVSTLHWCCHKEVKKKKGGGRILVLCGTEQNKDGE